jgi:hypothetical protein
VAEAVEGDERGWRWKVVSTGAPRGENFPVHEEVRKLLLHPPECLYLYEGMRCYTEKAFEEAIAPACTSLRDELDLTLVVEDSIPNRVYDHELSQGLGSKILKTDANGYFAEPVMERIPLKLYRVETDGPVAGRLPGVSGGNGRSGADLVDVSREALSRGDGRNSRRSGVS